MAEPEIEVGLESEPEPEPELEPEPQPRRTALRSYTRPRPSLLIAKEPVSTQSRKRAATGVPTNEQVGELNLVPARPAKKTRSGRTVKAMEKVIGAV